MRARLWGRTSGLLQAGRYCPAPKEPPVRRRRGQGCFPDVLVNPQLYPSGDTVGSSPKDEANNDKTEKDREE